MSSSSSSSSSEASSSPAPTPEATQAPAVSYGPALPPKEEWEPTDPLFMNKLPEDLSTVPGLEALQALNEEMTPEERADNFKDQGNEFFALGRHKYEEAIKCFTSAIREPGIDPKKRSTYYANRSFVNLKLENHASVIKDCKKAIELDPTNIKAYFRAASSMYETKQYQEAADMCDLGNKPRKQKQLLELKEKALAQLKIQREKQEEEQRIRQEGDGEKNILETAMKERGYQLGKKMFRAVHMYQGAPHWLNNDVGTNEIIFPVILLYPEYDQSDFIQNFSEYQTFRDQLEEIFPAPGSCEWDVRREYVPDNLVLYLQTNSTDLKDSDKVNYRKRLWKKVSLNSTLAEALQTPEYIIPNSIPVFYVFVNGSSYCREFLQRTD